MSTAVTTKNRVDSNDENCILKLIFDLPLYDEMTDVLLSFPGRHLEFISLDSQAHMQPLENITEQVSGFKRKKIIEVNTSVAEAKQLHRYILDALPSAHLQAQLLPLLSLD